MDYPTLRLLSPDTMLGGPEHIAQSMERLWEVDGGDPRMRGSEKRIITKHLLTIITSFPESLRFNHILEHVAGFFSLVDPEPLAAPKWILNIVRCWGKISWLVLKYKDSNEEEAVTEKDKTKEFTVYEGGKKIELMKAGEISPNIPIDETPNQQR
ncbi:hypothetical protein DM860_014661 [Cuscuta australis]|uniref:Uncharacterized protein n=1 Tax=Cuscuta australis TaxID=267555 RepID=A0A328DM25_9ASTE|nr:hypothetical protein DM860_014661 [Cuscuta australis]